MAYYVLLTRLAPGVAKSPEEIRLLSKKVSEELKKSCPECRWIANYVVMGPYDYLDIFEVPNEQSAMKVSMIVRTVGNASTETWALVPWEKAFEGGK
ncbi:MAG: GYD domain-containing protein [bacterium JZ-2024 1]